MPVRPTPADVLRLQRTLGNRAVGRLLTRRAEPRLQRMVALGNHLYYDSTRTGLPQQRLAEYHQNLAATTGLAPVDVTGANFAAQRQFQGVLAGALAQKLENDRMVFRYYPPLTPERFQTTLTNEDTFLVPVPRDMLDSPDDLTFQYQAGKACVLQALVNAGVEHPELDAQQQDDPAAWHDLLYNQKGIRYDDDTAIYQLYTGLGLTLVVNRPTLWKDLQLPAGRYVFSMPGHNFGVVVGQDGSYEARDNPQRRVLRYTEDLKVTYVWRA